MQIKLLYCIIVLQLWAQLKQLWNSIWAGVLHTHKMSDQLPIGMIAQLVEDYTGIPEAHRFEFSSGGNFFQALLSYNSVHNDDSQSCLYNQC